MRDPVLLKSASARARTAVPLVTALLLIVLGGGVTAQPTDSEAAFDRLVPTLEDALEAEYGADVAVSGDGQVAVVGAPEAALGTETSGAASIFVLTPRGWNLSATIGQQSGTADDRFGAAVAIDHDGDTLAVSAPGASGGQGRVLVYDDGDWDTAIEVDGDGQGFGSDIALDAAGETLVIGEPNTATTVGNVWVAQRADWTQTRPVMRPAAATQLGDAFGAAVAVSADGSTIAGGAPGLTSTEHPGGLVAIEVAADPRPVELRAGPGEPMLYLTSPAGAEAGDRVGASVALDGDGSRVVFGAPMMNETGAVWRVDEGDAFAGEAAASLPLEVAPEALAGEDVAMSADGATVLVGAPGMPAVFLVVGEDPAEGVTTVIPDGPSGRTVSLDAEATLCLLGMLPGGGGPVFNRNIGGVGGAAFTHFGNVSGTVFGEFDPDPTNGFEPAAPQDALVFLCALPAVPAVGPINGTRLGVPQSPDSLGNFAFNLPPGALVAVHATGSVLRHEVEPPFGTPPCQDLDQNDPSVAVVTAPASGIDLFLTKAPLTAGELILTPAVRVPGGMPAEWENSGQETHLAYQACEGATRVRATVSTPTGERPAQVFVVVDLRLTPRSPDDPPGTRRWSGTIPAGSIPPTADGSAVRGTAIVVEAVCPGGLETASTTAFLDPSGTVVDIFGDPVGSASVTILRESDNGTLVAVADGDASVLDPNVNLRNPSLTGPDGRFRWDTVPGTYGLRVSAEGCHAPGLADQPYAEVVTTPEGDTVNTLVVPPERMDLTLTLDCGPARSPEPPVPAPPFDGDPSTTEQVSDDSPSAAAVTMSRLRFPGLPLATPDYVVLGRVDDFPDNLAAAGLSSDGPLLLTDPAVLDAETGAEIDRLLGGSGLVYVLGGDVAVSDDVVGDLQQRGYDVRRLAGPTRVETALAVADEIRDRRGITGIVAVARSVGTPQDSTAGWADSLAGGVWSALTGVPVVVTPSDGLHPAVEAWITDRGVAQTVLFGGDAALSAAVADALPAPQRVSSPDRAETAAAVGAELIGLPPAPRAIVVDGYAANGFAYGLSAAGLAADRGAILLMANPEAGLENSVPPATATVLADCTDVAIIGAGDVTSSSVVERFDVLDEGRCEG